MNTLDSIHAPRAQRGLSLLGMLLFAIVAVTVVVVGMRVMPSALEYMAAKRAINRVASSGETNPIEIRRSFDRIAAVDDIVSIGAKDLQIERDGNSVRVSFRYEKRVALFGPASLVLDYQASAP
ncbi:MAG: DUF4845 domain-containing protein [Burkholderiaceae bacterium]|nr:DUF4845 domain-containing protein [Burkholderiaceae bacterium]